jgi:transcriptional regulator with XRE-family HTH domain
MSSSDTVFIEKLCDRFLLAQEATGLSQAAFASRVGLTSPQMTNIKKHRNPPSHEAIRNACREFGFPSDLFYEGVTYGVRDPAMAERLRARLPR